MHFAIKVLCNLTGSYGEKTSRGKSKNSLNLFSKFYLPESFVRKLIRVICACSVNQLLRIFASYELIRLVEISLKTLFRPSFKSACVLKRVSAINQPKSCVKNIFLAKLKPSYSSCIIDWQRDFENRKHLENTFKWILNLPSSVFDYDVINNSWFLIL